jgi:DNA repair exonuclease SbcCD ATPase subunit
MKQMDLIVQKDRELAKLNDTIRNLEERLANVNILLGGKDEALKNKDNEIKRIKDESNKSDRVIVKTVRVTDNRNSPYPYCNDKSEKEEITYKNFDLVKQELKTEVENKTKKNISELENTQLDLEIKIESLEKEISRKVNVVEAEARRRLNKLNEEHKEEVEDLKEEITKIKKNKTEQQLEEARTKEMEHLEITIKFLNKRLDLLRSKNWFVRLINDMFGKEADVSLELEELKLKAEVLKKQADAAYAVNQRYSGKKVHYDGSTYSSYADPYSAYRVYGMPCYGG